MSPEFINVDLPLKKIIINSDDKSDTMVTGSVLISINKNIDNHQIGQ